MVATSQRPQAIVAEGLVKVYRSRKSEVRALDGVDLVVEEGTVLGLLGTAAFTFGLLTAVAAQIPKLDPKTQRSQANTYVYASNGQRVLAILRGSQARIIVNSNAISPWLSAGSTTCRRGGGAARTNTRAVRAHRRRRPRRQDLPGGRRRPTWGGVADRGC